MPLFDHFKWVASCYERLFPFRDPQSLEKHLALPIHGRLLDVGGGTGQVSAAFRSLVGHVVILDESREMLQQARAKGLDVVQAHAEHLPFRDGAFERVLIRDAFHHLDDAFQAAKELRRVIQAVDRDRGRSGGRLIIEEPNIERRAVKLVAFLERLILMRSRFYSPPDMAQMIAGDDVRVSIERRDAIAWIIAEKL